MTEETKPIKLVAFLCNWCSYAGADLAGVSRFRYAPDIRIIRVPCSGRVDPQLPLLALQQGADGVLISGCHPGDCHYSDGNYYARRRFAIIHDLMEFLGMDPRRLQMSWVSASEGKKWADVVNSVVAEVRAARDEAEAAPAAQIVAEVGAEIKPCRPVAADAALTEKLRALAGELLASGKVKAVIGHGARPAGREGTTVRFVTSPDEVNTLTAYTGCTPNLAQYVKAAAKKYGPIAMVGKGSDFYSVANLEREGQIQPGQVQRIVVACEGAVDAADPRAGRCLLCHRASRDAVDTVLGTLPTTEDRADDFGDVARIEAMDRIDRAAYWDAQFANCLRCYACRNACPSCFCPVCFADNRKPTWVFPSATPLNNAFFHLVRAYHLAGRCSGCGECERVCPMDLPLLTLARKAAKTVRERFEHEPVADPRQLNPQCRFNASDEVEFIR